MAILKMFPVHFVSKMNVSKMKVSKMKEDPVHIPEHEPLVTVENCSQIDLIKEEVLMNGVACPLVYVSGRAFKNAECFNAARITPDQLNIFIQVDRKYRNIADVKLEVKDKYLKCSGDVSWNSDTIFGYKRKLYKNELKSIPISKDDENMDLTRIHAHVDTIPIPCNEVQTAYLPNKKFDHPLTMVCPVNPMYRCTKHNEDVDCLARPFPTENDLISMINFCKEIGNEGHVLFQNYGNPADHRHGCYQLKKTQIKLR
jgi:hypothetical protein